MESYAKGTYVSEELKDVQHPDARDFSKRFQLRLEMSKAQRGFTDQENAAVGIWVREILVRLPNLEPPEEEQEEKPKDAKEKPAKKRQSTLILPEPFQSEWRYRIVPPPGFHARALPENKTERWGAATLSQEFAVAAEGVVTATFRFDTGGRRQTAEQAEALRAGVEELRKREVLLINFDQVGAAHLSAGRIREALAEFRKLIQLHPTEALHHRQVARALLAAGIGEGAREQARRATEVEPGSAQAYDSLGWILQHDLVGRHLQAGFDLEGALAAYRKAKELDPQDGSPAGNLAILLEHDRWGVRYGPKARLGEAITEYQALGDRLEGIGLSNNLPIALMWARRFQEMEEAARNLDPAMHSATRNELLVVARAGREGSEAAIQQALREIPDAEARRKALSGAGADLMRLRMYKESADLLVAGVQGTPQASHVLARVGMIRNTMRHEDLVLDENDPRTAAKRIMLAGLDPDVKMEDILLLFSEESREESSEEGMATLRKAQAGFRAQAKASNTSLEVFLDLGLSAMQFTVEGDDKAGYKVRSRAPIANTGMMHTYYVVEENGKYVVLSTSENLYTVGIAVLARVESGDLSGARRLLDWVREDIELGGGEDPLAGPAFPRFWARGSNGDRDQIRYAAAALILSGKAEKGLPLLLEGREKAATDEQRLRFDLALAAAYAKLKRYSELAAVAERLQKTAPDSRTAFQYRITALVALRRWGGAEQVAQARLERLPGDAEATRALADLASRQGQSEKAMGFWRQLVDAGKATSSDLNSLAWQALVAEKLIPQAIETAQQASLLTEQKSFAILHTVASLYAEVGQTSEARSMILQAMEVEAMEEPNEESWYVFGRIAEQYGESQAAAAAYRKLNPPKENQDSPVATYHLAKRRLDRLIKDKKIKAK